MLELRHDYFTKEWEEIAASVAGSDFRAEGIFV